MGQQLKFYLCARHDLDELVAIRIRIRILSYVIYITILQSANSHPSLLPKGEGFLEYGFIIT